MLALLADLAVAAGTTPEDRVVVFAETGVYTAEYGLAFGVGAGWRLKRFLTAMVVGGVGGRTNVFDADLVEHRPGFGLGTVALALDTGPEERRALVFGPVALVDLVWLEAAERDCVGNACRHNLFWTLGDRVGIGAQPAGGVRIVGSGPSGASFAMSLALQPHYRWDEQLLAPRFDLAVSLGPDWSFTMWAGRHGGSVGIGHTLSRPRDP